MTHHFTNDPPSSYAMVYSIYRYLLLKFTVPE